MNIDSKWLRSLIAGLMLCCACGLASGCAEPDGGENIEEMDAGSDDIGAGGVDEP